MTVIEGLARLESPALWRPEPGAQRQEVYVAIGEAELVIQSPSGTALTHWSLPALLRLNPDKEPALYAPSEDSDEELEVEEPAMIEALDRVVAAVARGRARPGSLRRVTVMALVAALLIAGIVWLPGALRDRAATLLPRAKVEEIGGRMLDELTQVTGPACAAPSGVGALDRLRARVSPDRAGRVVVLRGLPQPAIPLPGGLVALSDGALLAHDDPDVAAGHLLSATVAGRGGAPLRAVLDGMPLLSVLRALTEGEMPQTEIERAVERLLTRDRVFEADAILARAFAGTGLAWAPWALAVGRDVDFAETGDTRPSLTDETWQRLRGICDE